MSKAKELTSKIDGEVSEGMEKDFRDFVNDFAKKYSDFSTEAEKKNPGHKKKSQALAQKIRPLLSDAMKLYKGL